MPKKRDEKWAKERYTCEKEKQDMFGVYYNQANGDYIFVNHTTGEKAVYNSRNQNLGACGW